VATNDDGTIIYAGSTNFDNGGDDRGAWYAWNIGEVLPETTINVGSEIGMVIADMNTDVSDGLFGLMTAGVSSYGLKPNTIYCDGYSGVGTVDIDIYQHTDDAEVLISSITAQGASSQVYAVNGVAPLVGSETSFHIEASNTTGTLTGLSCTINLR